MQVDVDDDVDDDDFDLEEDLFPPPAFGLFLAIVSLPFLVDAREQWRDFNS